MNFISVLKTILGGTYTFLDKTDNQLKNINRTLDTVINKKLENIRKVIVRQVFQLFFIFLSILAVLIGIIISLSKFYPVEIVLIISGILLLFISLVIKLILN